MADYHTKQRRQNIVVGLFVVVGFTLFVIMLAVFRDLPLFVSKFDSFKVTVQFPEVPGIQKDTPVRFCGAEIGRVMHVAQPESTEDDLGRKKHKVIVTLSLKKDYLTIPRNVEVLIVKKSLGSSHIELRDTSLEVPTAFLEEGTKLVGSVSTANEFFPPDVQAKIEHLVDSIADLADNVNLIVGDEENQSHLKNTFANVEEATAQARETLKSIERFSETSTEKVDTLGTQIGAVAEQLEGALSEMRQVIAKIESGQGSAGKLVNDGQLYENLLESSEELQMALEQIKQWAGEAREKGIRIKW